MPVSEPAATTDAFLGGCFEVFQPVDGHRAGLDALLIAACVPRDLEGTLADFGAGAGVAGFAALCGCRAKQVDLIENAVPLASLTRRSVDLPANRHLKGRVRILEADILAPARERREAGLADQSYDFAITNPPYNDSSFRKPSSGGKAAAHMMSEDLLDRWMRAITAALKPGGRFVAILRPRSLTSLLAATGSRFGGLVLKPVQSRVDTPASRLLVGGVKGSRAPLAIVAPLIVHDQAGTLSSHVQAISCGAGFIDLFGERDYRPVETAPASEHLTASVD